MKKNKLFLAALSLMAIAACTSDELESSSVKQSVSPVQFMMTNDDATRADFTGAKALKFTPGDLVTLYHGGTVTPGTGVSLGNVQNATYTTGLNDANNVTTFKTPSMILPGQAIMVYPADTTFIYDGSDLYVEVPTNQTTANILDKIPYISDGIEIGSYVLGNMNGSGAGYGRNYNIAFKAVATYYTLNTVYTGGTLNTINALVASDGIEPIRVEKITLNRPTDQFNKKVKVVLNDPSGNQATNWKKDKPNGLDANGNPKWGNNAKSWNKVSKVDYETAASCTKTSSIVSEDGDLNSANFIILPQVATAVPATDASIVVDTYYGRVTLNNASGNVMYHLDGNNVAWKEDIDPTDATKKGKVKVQEGLEYMIKKTRNVQTTASALFRDEELAGRVSRHIDVDLSKLDMEVLHIKDKKQLIDVLKVWKALNIASATLTIDGGKNGNPAGVFEMPMEAVNLINAGNGSKTVKIKVCDVPGEACTKVVLTGGGEVPNLGFFTGNSVEVELGAGYNWSWNQTALGTGATSVKTTSSKVVKIINAGTLDIENVNVDAFAPATEWENATTGTINISKVTTWKDNIVNYGTINIGDGNNKNAELRAYDAIITNDAKSVSNQGIINNYGVIGVTEGTMGKVNNYGTIELKNADAMTLISSNETGTETGGVANFANAWSTTNKLGTINLYGSSHSPILSVSNAAETGIIRYTYTPETTGPNAGKYVTPGSNVKYNCIVISTDIEFTGTEAEVQFIEFNGSRTKVINPASGSSLGKLRGVIINAGKSIVIEKNNKLDTGTVYMGDGKSAVYYGGVFTYNNTISKYFGYTGSTDQIVKF